MRKAELVMAIVLAILSIYLMWKSAELPIGWVHGSGPGGGAFPFWLSAGMLLCCVWIIVRWVRRTSPPSRSTEVYMDRAGLEGFLWVAGAITVMIGLIHIIGTYFSMALFLAFYLRVLGRHSWTMTLLVAILTPIATFFFFDIALRITLPKGYAEPLFYPLYHMFL